MLAVANANEPPTKAPGWPIERAAYMCGCSTRKLHRWASLGRLNMIHRDGDRRVYVDPRQLVEQGLLPAEILTAETISTN